MDNLLENLPDEEEDYGIEDDDTEEEFDDGMEGD